MDESNGEAVGNAFPSPCGELRVSDFQSFVNPKEPDMPVVSVPLRGIEGV